MVARSLALVAVSIIVLVLLTACQTQPSGDFCQISKPIRLTPATVDAMTDDEVTAVLRQNRLYQELCGTEP